MAKTLDERVHREIRALCRAGDDQAAAGRYLTAIDTYNKALEMLPEPKFEWEASTWILTALGDAFFALRDWDNALNRLQAAVLCPGGMGNPFIHMRLGQAWFEIGNHERAKDELARAFLGAGEDVFKREDPKYLSFVKPFLRPDYEQN